VTRRADRYLQETFSVSEEQKLFFNANLIRDVSEMFSDAALEECLITPANSVAI
jgi:hypothetical protein